MLKQSEHKGSSVTYVDGGDFLAVFCIGTPLTAPYDLLLPEVAEHLRTVTPYGARRIYRGFFEKITESAQGITVTVRSAVAKTMTSVQ